MFLEQGVTTAYELPASAAGVAAYQDLERSGELPIRLQLGFTIAPGHQPLGDLDTLLATGLRTGFGNDRLRIGPIKIFVDGSGPSAATYLPDQPGLLMRSGETLASEVLRAHRAGWQLWIHAIGDRAQDLALDALESALAIAPRADPRHRIEHLGNVWREPALERAKRLGVIPVPTAAFLWLVPDQTARAAAHRSTRSARCSIAATGRPATPTPPARRPSPSIPCSACRVRSCAPTGTACR